MDNARSTITLQPRYSVAVVASSVGLAVILVSTLFSTPRPQAIANQPWRVELLISIFAIPFLYWVFHQPFENSIRHSISSLNLAAACSGLFILWSGVSAFWSELPLTAIFQTLVWAIYVVLFVGFLRLLRAKKGYPVIVGVFFMLGLVLGLLTIFDVLSIQDFAISQGTIRVRYAKYAELMLTAAPLIAVASIYLRSRVSSTVSLCIWLLSWLAVMLSLSKGAFLAGIITHLILFGGCLFFSHGRPRKKVALRAVIWLVFTVAVQAGFSSLTTIPSTSDYISGAADKTRDTSTFRVNVWQVGTKMAVDHWFLGVGSGNFGVAYNDSRAAFAAAKPDDRTPEYGQDYMFERAHNEPLQIFAELGVIGLLLFTAIFGSFVYLTVIVFIRKRFKLSPMFWAAIAGTFGFLASSMVSSFSFRAVQNGVVFVMVLSVAVYELTKASDNKPVGSRSGSGSLLTASLISALALAGFAAPKGIAEYFLYRAERAADPETSSQLFRTALSLDPDNASAYYYFASRSSFDNDNATAVKMLRIGINKGIGVTLTYSLLAKYQLLADDAASAEQTLAEAVRIFPNSVFIRVRYATFLADQRKQALSDREMEYARSIDARQANGWEILIRKGSTAAFYSSTVDPSVAPPADLSPTNAVYEYLDKRPGE